MKKKKLVFLAFATIAIALLLEAGILKYVNDSNTYRMSKVLLDRVITVLNKNDDSENELIKSLKDDYIVRAKAVSYIIDAKPQVEYDVEELQKIADLILVDEIHLFDKNGGHYGTEDHEDRTRGEQVHRAHAVRRGHRPGRVRRAARDPQKPRHHAIGRVPHHGL